MRVLFAILMVIIPSAGFAQVESAESRQRSGLLIGAAAGGGLLGLTGGGVEPGRRASPSFPNLKIGYMLSDRVAAVVLFPATIYRHDGAGEQDRARDRGFEGIIPSIQFWAGDRWWLIGGAGLGLDAPTFYDVRDPGEGKYHFGTSVSVGAGYDVWQRGRFSADVQSRLHYGTARLGEGETRRGLALNFLIGFTAY